MSPPIAALYPQGAVYCVELPRGALLPGISPRANLSVASSRHFSSAGGGGGGGKRIPVAPSSAPLPASPSIGAWEESGRQRAPGALHYRGEGSHRDPPASAEAPSRRETIPLWLGIRLDGRRGAGITGASMSLE
ncbi:hypothetical protein AAFF_G00416250 [Aldrovandia affinis]|uniref:Uncharacterized protein n=1 Tax=Aldrovandia affinis TaxID=143900 RepID=A0AAD7SAU7_9TELE|nr:hypothetical protein AAFF_G00416250 [Aldrovandia affinis]